LGSSVLKQFWATRRFFRVARRKSLLGAGDRHTHRTHTCTLHAAHLIAIPHTHTLPTTTTKPPSLHILIFILELVVGWVYTHWLYFLHTCYLDMVLALFVLYHKLLHSCIFTWQHTHTLHTFLQFGSGLLPLWICPGSVLVWLVRAAAGLPAPHALPYFSNPPPPPSLDHAQPHAPQWRLPPRCLAGRPRALCAGSGSTPARLP